MPQTIYASIRKLLCNALEISLEPCRELQRRATEFSDFTTPQLSQARNKERLLIGFTTVTQACWLLETRLLNLPIINLTIAL